MGGSKGNLCYNIDVAHPATYVTTSTGMHIILTYVIITPGLLWATGKTTALYKACLIDIDCGFEFRYY